MSVPRCVCTKSKGTAEPLDKEAEECSPGSGWPQRSAWSEISRACTDREKHYTENLQGSRVYLQSGPREAQASYQWRSRWSASDHNLMPLHNTALKNQRIESFIGWVSRHAGNWHVSLIVPMAAACRHGLPCNGWLINSIKACPCPI